MPKRKLLTYEAARRKRRRTSADPTRKNPGNPFEALPWEVATNILAFLPHQDLVRIGQVHPGRKSLLDHWLIDQGRRCVPEAWHADVHSVEKFEDKVQTVKRSIISHSAHIKLSTGKASCARRYQNNVSERRLFSTNGDYVVWHANHRIYWQNLAFKPDGSLHPIQKLRVRVAADNLEYLEVNEEGYVYYQICHQKLAPWEEEVYKHHVVHLPTGIRLWSKRAVPDTRFFAMGKERIYYCYIAGSGNNNRFLTARDIKSGRQLYEVPFSINIPMNMTPVAIQRASGSEVLVAFHIAALLPNVYFVNGIQIINGSDGRMLQFIQTRIWGDEQHIIPDPLRPGHFAVVSHIQNSEWNIKIERFAEDTEDGIFRNISREWLPLGKFPGPINRVSIHPYRNLAVSIEQRRALLRVREILVNTNPSTDRQTFPRDSPPIPTNWLQLSEEHEITLPPKYKHHKKRRLFLPGPLDNGPYHPELSFVGWDRVLMRSEPAQFYCLFDFRFRMPCNLGGKVHVPNVETLEIR
ncbi:hypothetical protein BDW69DRAFT_189211 [Aspergillus filifer]